MSDGIMIEKSDPEKSEDKLYDAVINIIDKIAFNIPVILANNNPSIKNPSFVKAKFKTLD